MLTLKKTVHLIRLPADQSLIRPFHLDQTTGQEDGFHSVTRTPEEISILTSRSFSPNDLTTAGATVEGPYKLLRLRGPLPLGMLSW